jgi:hypothetical protein
LVVAVFMGVDMFGRLSSKLGRDVKTGAVKKNL